MAAEALTNIIPGKHTRERRGPAVESTMLVYQANERTHNITATQINIITNTWGRQLGTGGRAGTIVGKKSLGKLKHSFVIQHGHKNHRKNPINLRLKNINMVSGKSVFSSPLSHRF